MDQGIDVYFTLKFQLLKYRNKSTILNFLILYNQYLKQINIFTKPNICYKFLSFPIDRILITNRQHEFKHNQKFAYPLKAANN